MARSDMERAQEQSLPFAPQLSMSGRSKSAPRLRSHNPPSEESNPPAEEQYPSAVQKRRNQILERCICLVANMLGHPAWRISHVGVTVESIRECVQVLFVVESVEWGFGREFTFSRTSSGYIFKNIQLLPSSKE